MSNNLKFTGRVTRIDEVEEGISKNGNAWQKQTFKVSEEEGDYPADVYFTLFGKKVDDIDLDSVMGEMVEVSFNLKGREYTSKDGRVFQNNEVTAWRVSKL